MKIRQEHYQHMLDAITTIGVDKLRCHRQFIVNEGKAKDVEKRLRWDASYYAHLTPFIGDQIYSYADDTHVDTALRSIMRELGV